MNSYDFYIFGPITGNQNFKKDFAEAEAYLTKHGFTCFNPARLSDNPEVLAQAKTLPEDEQWKFWMDQCKPHLKQSRMGFGLHGWASSKGARIEEGYFSEHEKPTHFLCLPVLYLISGRKRSGKDTFATWLVAERRSLAAPLKKVYMDIFGEEITEENKAEPSGYGFTPREWLQWFGTDVMQYGMKDTFPDYTLDRLVWVNALTKKILRDLCTDFAIPDVRFPHEVDALKAFGKQNGYIVKTIRIESDRADKNDSHESETALDNYKFDMYILNNGTIAELKQKAKTLQNEIQEGR